MRKGDNMVEEKIGNCTLNKLIAMLENGWKIKKMVYRAFRDGLPCWTVEYTHPIVYLATQWFQLQKNDLPKWIGHRDNYSGFNEIVFERPSKSQ